MANNFYPVILAGGRGTRFWPLSRKKRAKQLREQMTAKIGKVKVAPVDAPNNTSELVGKPLMSYTDEPLSINGATLWAWSRWFTNVRTIMASARPAATTAIR